MDKQKADYAVYILTHGRPDNQKTLKTLMSSGCSENIYLIVDDEDQALNEYEKKYPDKVLTFSKKDYVNTTDCIDPSGSTKAVVFARNATFDIAKKEGHKAFIVLDDDYSQLDYTFNGKIAYNPKKCSLLDDAFRALVEYYESAPQITSLCIMQGGDFIGGGESKNGKKIIATRKAMNFFVCSPTRRFQFMGRINEDTNAYTSLQHSGQCLFLSTSQFRLKQTTTQKNQGGLTDIYLELGTFVKSFYTVIVHPSGTFVKAMGDHHMRLHHHVISDATYPKIIRESHCKLAL